MGSSQLNQLDSDDGMNNNVDEMVDVFQQWLVRKSSCPITFDWLDLGEYFWPRYIRQGECNQPPKSPYSKFEVARSSTSSSKKQMGCSWPKGMKCVQGEAETLQILRWHCRRRKRVKSDLYRTGSKHRCKWYKIPYPVTTSCRCACSD